MSTDKLIEESKKYIMNTYARYPVVFIKGRGMKLYDSDGREYTDFLSGISVNNLGHCHPKVVVAVQKQVQRLIHVSNLYHIEPQIKLAKALVQNSFADRVFFCNSGAEANEAAIKLARKYARKHMGPDRYEIITAEMSFHGRTYGAVTATGQDKMHKDYEPLVPGFRYVPFGDAAAVADAVGEGTCAVMMEPIQAEGGVNLPPEGYFRELRSICDEKGVLLILDEVQTGIGRTGRLFAYEHYGIEPDIMSLAKALGGGVAIGATLATEKVADAFGPGDHASTFGGNPIACAAGVAALDAVLEDGWLIGAAERVGEYMLKTLRELAVRHTCIKDVRGMGLLVGVELDSPCADIVRDALARGYVINCTVGNVIRLAPPLIVTEEEVDGLVDTLDSILEKRCGG